MSLRNLSGWVLLGVFCVGAAKADWITSWGQGSSPDDFVINQFAGTIVIKQGNGNVYKFFSETTEHSGVPGVIEDITVDSGASGNFTIWIQDDSTPNGAPGASDVKQMNLTYGGGTATVYVLWTSEDIGEDGPVTLENLNGPIIVGGASEDTLTIDTWDTRAELRAVNLVGTVTINDDVNDDAADITISDTLSGTLNINGTLYGDLSITNTLSGDVNISGDMSGDFSVDDLSGTLAIGGDEIGNIDIDDTLSGTIEVTGDIPQTTDKHVRIKFMDGGTIECTDMGLVLGNTEEDDWLVIGHDLTNQQLAETTHTGTVTIDGVLSGRVYVRGYSAIDFTVDTVDADDDPPWREGGIETTSGFTSASSITVADFTAGRIGLIRNLLPPGTLPTVSFDGEITVTDSMGADARIDTLNPHLTGTPRLVDIEAAIEIQTTMAGTIRSSGDLTGEILVDGDMTGMILIDGELTDGAASSDIEITGTMSSASAVTVDYNGWDSGDDWESGAIITVDATNFSEASSSVNAIGTAPNFWHVTECIGDCNNDGTLDSFDVEPFIDIISEGAPYSEYASNYPGLLGSAVYHADADCDGEADAFDIEPFIDKLNASDCDCALHLGGCRIVATTIVRPVLLMLLTGANMAPARSSDKADRIIELFGTYAPSRHYDYLLDSAAFLSAHYQLADDLERSQMWAEVYDGFAERFAE